MTIMTIYVDATDLKYNISSVLNSVYFGGNTALVKKHGKVIVRIVPANIGSKGENFSSKKYFGILPDFPEVSSKRHFSKRKISL